MLKHMFDSLETLVRTCYSVKPQFLNLTADQEAPTTRPLRIPWRHLDQGALPLCKDALLASYDPTLYPHDKALWIKTPDKWNVFQSLNSSLLQ
jgi:hypothetical protein